MKKYQHYINARGEVLPTLLFFLLASKILLNRAGSHEMRV